ncbi:MAG: M23 family metallopeptidase [Pseudomonadota bacterium]|nr:M23 family metallopeptidase [Pseudomonadota bacterium]
MTSSDFLDRIAVQLGQCTGDFLRKHPRRGYAAIVLVLAGFGATAFGVAPLSASIDSTPQQWVTESVTPSDLGEQVLSLAQHDLSLFRNEVTRPSDTADSLLRRLNVDDTLAIAFLRGNSIAREVLSGRSGKMIQVRTNASGDLDELVARYPARSAAQFSTHFTRLRITRENGQFVARLETALLAAQARMGSGTVRNSLFNATDDAGIPDSVANQLAEVFSTDINFHRELRRGDTFSVVYEALTADGEPITWNESAGRVLAAEFVNNGKVHSAIWYEGSEAGSRGAYFDFSGHSKQRSFLASPMEFSRITSGFAMRFHPILQNWRQHAGVDYSAPIGTPVRTVSDGIVEFAGWQNGYGNVVLVKHVGDRSTLYAHLSRIDVRKGQTVQQGMHLGAVGATGWATGPHLHFEFKVGGVQRDPVAIASLTDTVTLAPASRIQFEQWAQSAKVQLNAAETLSQASSSFE